MSWRRALGPQLEELSPYQVERPEDLVRLDANESPLSADLSHVLDRLRSLPLNRYPDAAARRLREAAARRWGVAPEQVIPGNGSDEVLSILMTAVGGAGRPRPARVAYPMPTFGMYGLHAAALGLERVEIPTGSDFRLEPEAVLAVLERARPELFFLARPNNPTGTLWPRAVAEGAAALDAGLVVVDEAYGPFSGESCLDLLAQFENVVVMQTLSKVGFAALRVGFAIASPAVAGELEKVRLPYNVDALSMALAVEVLERWDELVAPIVEEVVAARGALVAGLRDLGLSPFETAGNFVLVRLPDADGAHAALKRAGLLVRNLHRPGTPLEGCLRITVGAPAENERLLEALSTYLRRRER